MNEAYCYLSLPLHFWMSVSLFGKISLLNICVSTNQSFVPSAECGATVQDATLQKSAPVAFSCDSCSCFQGNWAELQSSCQGKVHVNRHWKIEHPGYLVSLLMCTFHILPYVPLLKPFNSGML